MPDTEALVAAHDPHGTPSWLWDLAGEIAAMKRTPSRFGRHTILMAAVGHLRAAAGRRGKSVPAIEEAMRIHDADAPLRWELEARLLAGQDDEEISARCGIPAEVVAAYAALFFDVRGRLDADCWIATRVIGPGLHRGFKADEVAALWKAVARDRGAGVLDAVVDVFRASRREDDLPTLDVYFGQRSTAPLGMRANIAAMTLPPGKRTQAGLGVIFGRLADIRRMPASKARREQESRLAADIARLYREGPEFLLDGEAEHTPKIASDSAGQAALGLADEESRPARPNPPTSVVGTGPGEDLPAAAATSTALSRQGGGAGGCEPSPREQATRAKVQRQADIIREFGFAANMASAISLGDEVGAAGFKVYLDEFVREAGNPTDPVEKLLLQQLALAHHRVAALHSQAANAESVEAAKIYSAAATRLAGETRRLALALRQYRHPLPRRQTTFIRQQNLARGDQQVAYLDQASSVSEAPLHGDSEQGSKRLTYAPIETLNTQSEAGGGRTPQPQAARPADPGGA